jgi:hypothetical protein
MFDVDLPRRHRSVRQVARAQYHLQREKDAAAAEQSRATRRGAALRLLAAFRNRFEHAGTLYEVLVFAREQLGDETFRDISQIRPRVNDLLHLGLVEPLPARACRITKAHAHPWRVRPVGSREAR